jgi:hypothetical protein
MCNILRQNPNIMATDTSTAHAIAWNQVVAWSGSPEVIGGLQKNSDALGVQLRSTLQATFDTWYAPRRQEQRELHGLSDDAPITICDKSRIWTLRYDLLRGIWPNAKQIVLVRDLREVVASLERRSRQPPQCLLTDGRPALFMRRLMTYFNENPPQRPDDPPLGIIGEGLMGIRNLLQMNVQDNVMYVRAEDFAESPQHTMSSIYKFLDMDVFEDHDFEDVKKVCTDPDYLYQGFFPHEGKGKVEKRPSTWDKWMSKGIADQIVREYLWYFLQFEYVEIPSPAASPNAGMPISGHPQGPNGNIQQFPGGVQGQQPHGMQGQFGPQQPGPQQFGPQGGGVRQRMQRPFR